MLGLAKRVKAKILQASTSEIYGDPEIHPQIESYWGPQILTKASSKQSHISRIVCRPPLARRLNSKLSEAGAVG